MLAGLQLRDRAGGDHAAPGLTGGTYQFLPTVDAATAAALKGARGVKVLQTQDLAYSLIGMNVTKPPFDKPAVREALNYALNRAQIVQAAYFGRQRAGGTAVAGADGLGAAGHRFSLLSSPTPRKPKALAAAGGTALPVKVTLNVLGSLQVVVDIAQVVQAQAEQGRLRRGAERAGAGPLHPGLARRQLRRRLPR